MQEDALSRPAGGGSCSWQRFLPGFLKLPCQGGPEQAPSPKPSCGPPAGCWDGVISGSGRTQHQLQHCSRARAGQGQQAASRNQNDESWIISWQICAFFLFLFLSDLFCFILFYFPRSAGLCFSDRRPYPGPQHPQHHCSPLHQLATALQPLTSGLRQFSLNRPGCRPPSPCRSFGRVLGNGRSARSFPADCIRAGPASSSRLVSSRVRPVPASNSLHALFSLPLACCILHPRPASRSIAFFGTGILFPRALLIDDQASNLSFPPRRER